MPEIFSALSKTWRQKHLGWEYMFWTDDMNRSFIKRNNPEFLSVYDRYPYNIQRVDAVRYFILYEMGGVFVDLDFECIRSVEPLIDGHDCVFGLEPQEHSKRHRKNQIVCNAFMACSPRNDLFFRICQQLQHENFEQKKYNRDWEEVLESTGPFRLTDIYENYPRKAKVKLLSPEVLYPLTISETRILMSGSFVGDSIRSRIERAYAVHYFFGSWWQEL